MEFLPSKGPEIICSAFIEKDKKFLIFSDPKFKVWRVPGGRAEAGERIEDTIVREMKEEIGIEINNPRFLGYGQDQQFHFKKNMKTSRLLMFFHARITEEPTVDSSEAEEYKWVTLDEMKKIENKEGGLTDFFHKNPKFSL